MGLRTEFPMGVVSVKSGLAKVGYVTKENFVRNGGMFSDPQYDLKKYSGYGVPLQFDLVLGGRFVGVGISVVNLWDGDGHSAGFLIGVPMGLLRG